MRAFARQVVYFVKLLIAASILSVGVSYIFAWTVPPQEATPPATSLAAPDCPAGYPGCDAPINVGPSDQTKSGGLQIGTTVHPANITIVDGNQADGKVLVSNGAGQAGWINIWSSTNYNCGSGNVLQGINSTGAPICVAMSGGTPPPPPPPPTGSAVYAIAGTYTWTVPAGVTSIQVEAWGGGAGDSGGGDGRFGGWSSFDGIVQASGGGASGNSRDGGYGIGDITSNGNPGGVGQGPPTCSAGAAGTAVLGAGGGGKGKGGTPYGTGCNPYPTSGGGSGGYAKSTLSVTSGTGHNVSVGAAGNMSYSASYPSQPGRVVISW